MAEDHFPRLSASTDLLGRLVANYPKFWIRMGNAESRLLALDLSDVAIQKPVYICGLARSGSTILLEMLASLPIVATHRYSDFPFLFTPYWWNTLLKLTPFQKKEKYARAHADGIMVSPGSPEAMEEMLWMAFFRGVHVSQRSQLLTSASEHKEFEDFYRYHIQKLLLARKRSRYVSKANYHITRMGYIQRLFPDARFIVPVREPVAHIISLMRQHARFCAAGQRDKRIIKHMSTGGHFEFGMNRIPINTGNNALIEQIEQAWNAGEEARGWALYWDMLYRFLHEQLTVNSHIRDHVYIMKYETLTHQPYDSISALLQHAGFPAEDAFIKQWATKLHAPDYYTADLSATDCALIRSITEETAARFGY